MVAKQLKIKVDEKVTYYLVICRGGATKTYYKNVALQLAKDKESKNMFVRVYESKYLKNGFDTLTCIYYTGCGIDLVGVWNRPKFNHKGRLWVFYRKNSYKPLKCKFERFDSVFA